MLAAEEPAPAKKFSDFYAKAFDPAKFFKDPIGGAKQIAGA